MSRAWNQSSAASSSRSCGPEPSGCRGARKSSTRVYRYLIVGGGLVADAACKGIREHDVDGTIGVVADEAFAPYARPPLSKALWRKSEGEDTVWCGTADLEVDVRLGKTIASFDLLAHQVTDDTGETYAHERLLLAAGGRPRRLGFRGEADRHPRGVLLWNIFGRVEAARDLIRARRPIDASTLREPVG